MRESGIRRFASRLRVGVLVAFALLLVLIAWARIGVHLGGVPIVLESHAGSSSGIVGFNDAILLILAIAIYWLTQALRVVADGELFSSRVVRRFRLFSFWMLVAALFNALAPMILSAAEPAIGGRHRIMLLIDVRDLLLISLTLLMLLISRMFERARAIEDEMSEIV